MRFGGECDHRQEWRRPLFDRDRFWSPAQEVCGHCGEVMVVRQQYVADLPRESRRPYDRSA